MVLGVLFVILCGVDIAYSSIFLATDDPDEPELEGHPVKFNKTGALIPVTDVLYIDTPVVDDEFNDHYQPSSLWERRAIIYMALINSGLYFICTK
jgi:hypothetical protein